jgi:hypothetical protein
MADVKLITVSDDRYFVGTVGMVNSVRLTGHAVEIVVLDNGFTRAQADLLGPECTLVPAPTDHGIPFATYLKPIAPLALDADVTVFIDSDIIVTGRLDDVIESAAAGRVVAYADPEGDRWFAEWEQVFELPQAPRRDAYLCAALVAMSQRQHPEMLGRWWDACRRAYAARTAGAGEPVSQADQDALNAVLMGWYPEGTVEVRPGHEAPQAHELRRGVDVDDLRTLQCSYRGRPTLLLHSAGRPKPWVPVGARQTAYTALLHRLLSGSDLPVRVPPDMVPRWLRDGRAPAMLHSGLNLYSRARASISRRADFVPAGLRGQVSRLLP